MPRTLLLPLLVSALLLAACGKDGRDEKATTTSATTTTAPTAKGCKTAAAPEPKDTQLEAPDKKLDPKKTYTVRLQTSCGTIDIALGVKSQPKTAASFAHLVREGFFDGLTFHRISKDPNGDNFVIQGGDPLGTGEGGAGYNVTEKPPENARYTRGVVAMAKTAIEDPGTSGSQFFIVTGQDAGLPPDYAVAGKVIGGSDAVDRIAATPADPGTERPLSAVLIEKATLSERR